MERLPLKNAELLVTSSRGFTYHAGLVLSGDEALLIDPGLLPDEIDTLAEQIPANAATSSRTVLTHGHWDHVLGPERLPRIPTIAQKNFPIREGDPR